MKCNHNDCFTCPYPDCILGSKDACYSPEKLEERRKRRKEYQHQQYLKRKAMKAQRCVIQENLFDN